MSAKVVAVHLVRRDVGPPAARIVRSSNHEHVFQVQGEMTVAEFRLFGDLVDQALTEHLEFTFGIGGTP